MGFPVVDRTILSAKDKKNLAGAQELAALLTDLDIQRHKVQHALRDMSEYLPKGERCALDVIDDVVEKYRANFEKHGYVVFVNPGANFNDHESLDSFMVAVHRGLANRALYASWPHTEQVVKFNYSIVESNKTTLSDLSPVCEIKCLVRYDDRVQAFTFYLLQDLIDHLESVFLSLLAG